RRHYRAAGRDHVPRRPPPPPHAHPAAYPAAGSRHRRQGRGAGGRRALLRPHHPRGPGRAGGPGPAADCQAGRPGGPRAPRAADPGRPRRQEPAHLLGGKGEGPARRNRYEQRQPGRRRGSYRGFQRMKHLLSTADLAKPDAVQILDTAEEMSAVSLREVKKLPVLRGRTVVNLFFEDSTRTRISFEAAAKRLSADVINFAAKGSSVSKGESLQDTAQTLQAMGADAVVIRHGASGAPRTLASSGWITAGVVNAGDGTHEHPTQ